MLFFTSFHCVHHFLSDGVCDCILYVGPQVLVLLDVTPDQSMVDEGVAREVINRIQKLRKKVSSRRF